MHELRQDQIKEIIKKYPLVEEVVNEIRQNSTYGKFCVPYVIIEDQMSLDNTDHMLFTFIFRMSVKAGLQSHEVVEFRVEWSKRYYYHELERVIKYITKDFDLVILRNVSDVISRHTDINLINFNVTTEPYKMAWEIGD